MPERRERCGVWQRQRRVAWQRQEYPHPVRKREQKQLFIVVCCRSLSSYNFSSLLISSGKIRHPAVVYKFFSLLLLTSNNRCGSICQIVTDRKESTMKPKTTKRQPPTEVRGVPFREYRAYARLVRLGKTTWAKLEKAGDVRPNERHTDAYRRVMKKTVKR
jgi:hypothetical protein